MSASLFALAEVVCINHLTSVGWMWFKCELLFCLTEFYISCTLLFLLWLTVLSEWMSLFLPCDSFLERYISLFRVLGLAVPLWSPGLYRPSSRAGPCCCSTPGLAPSPPRSSVINTPPLQVPPLSSSIFTNRQNKARLFILTMKEQPNWLFLSSSSSLQLVYNEPWGSF